MGVENAFASAIVQSSDEYFREALKKRPDLVRMWLQEYAPKMCRRRTHET
jgi:lysyl-tRNA synthetase class I